jgi:hypothetical protein
MDVARVTSALEFSLIVLLAYSMLAANVSIWSSASWYRTIHPRPISYALTMRSWYKSTCSSTCAEVGTKVFIIHVDTLTLGACGSFKTGTPCFARVVWFECVRANSRPTAEAQLSASVVLSRIVDITVCSFKPRHALNIFK